MGLKLTVYPRYYVTATPEAESNMKSDGDPEVVDLYSMYMNRTVRTDSWGYRRRVFAAAHRLLGPSFTAWLELQQNNPSIAGLNLEYLVDTVRFLQGNHRQVSYPTWIELLNELGDGNVIIPRSSVSLSRPAGLKETAQALQAWCRRPRGFEDLVCFLFACFGKSRRSGA